MLAATLPGNAHPDLTGLARDIRVWGLELGVGEIGIDDIGHDAAEAHLLAWQDAGRNGAIDYTPLHAVRGDRQE